MFALMYFVRAGMFQYRFTFTFALVAIRYTRSRLARDLYCAGCLKTLRFVSIRLNRQESVSLLVSSSHFPGSRLARDLYRVG